MAGAPGEGRVSPGAPVTPTLGLLGHVPSHQLPKSSSPEWLEGSRVAGLTSASLGLAQGWGCQTSLWSGSLSHGGSQAFPGQAGWAQGLGALPQERGRGTMGGRTPGLVGAVGGGPCEPRRLRDRPRSARGGHSGLVLASLLPWMLTGVTLSLSAFPQVTNAEGRRAVLRQLPTRGRPSHPAPPEDAASLLFGQMRRPRPRGWPGSGPLQGAGASARED